VPSPQVTRRIELIASPITPFEAAIKASGNFYGLGSAAMIDSYNSANGSYYFSANTPTDPNYVNSRFGSVEIGTAVATVMGTLYGNLSTNGGTVVRSSNVTGAIDNNVPFTLPPYKMPSMPAPQASPTSANSNPSITPPGAGTASVPIFYLFSSLSGRLTLNPYVNPSGSTLETYVAVHVTNDISGTMTINPHVHAEIFFDGSLNIKARDLDNQTGIAGNLQLYGISPTDGSRQQINIGSPGDFAAVIYAPSADYTMNGNPDITGAIVCKSFYGNGNTSWHYDRALDSVGEVVDYRIASYIEDLR
jgi:hypothetical protein